ncbi:SDR family oxidoreductase [Hymenobacter tibetensis]|uniref:SDR family oxidoreductase n=1 Tax=Hymenobacter tibetensis TaxID=497967 RepID=A0ABY4D2L5_9BACT|nr:SDR family oxidoreductase [Hymenobacter tibetensis]UOG76789.1 SDR family oxidoreductase [Hymenobacter tibetensis]
MENNVWFVTGASKGLGLTLVKQLLAAGNYVAATSRTTKALTAAVGQGPSDHFLPLEMDLVNEQSVEQAIAATVATFGRLDVVVNNAGYLQFGTIEELTDAEVRRNLDVNIFGVLNVIRHAVPHLRRQNSGHVFNLASIGGYSGQHPGAATYTAGKFAVAGLSAALAAEVKPFNIHVTIVYPGTFRTDFLAGSSLMMPAQPVAEYTEVRAAEQQWAAYDGQQPGDPEKAMAVLLAVADSTNPPLHLFLGPDAYEAAAQQEAAVQQERAAWEEVATATNFTAD